MPLDPQNTPNKKFEPGQEPMLEPSMEPIKKKVIRKPKPIIEGINSAAPGQEDLVVPEPVPVVTPNLSSTLVESKKVQLTDAEKILMNTDTSKPSTMGFKEQPKETLKPQIIVTKEDPRLLSKKAVDRANGKGGHIFRNLLLIVVAVILVFGSYELYGWYMHRPSGLEPVSNQTPTPTEISTPTPVTEVTPTPTPTPVTIPQTILKISSTPTGYLNVRSEPKTTGKLLVQVHPGDLFVYTDQKNGWYQITLTDGTSGWVTAQYVVVQK